MISFSNSPSRRSGMPIQVRGVLVHALSGTELSRVRTEFRLRLPEPINKSPLESRGADIVMQSSGVLERNVSDRGSIEFSESLSCSTRTRHMPPNSHRSRTLHGRELRTHAEGRSLSRSALDYLAR